VHKNIVLVVWARNISD